MRTLRAAAALLLAGVTACTASSGVGGTSPTGTTGSSAATSPAAGCPADKAEIAALLGESIVRAEGATSGSTAQICAFGTDLTDLGALSVVYLRFPRANLKAKTLAQARRLYGTPLTWHTIVAMPKWGTDAFLDESELPDQDVTAEFAWIPGFEVILGMHSSDPHVAHRRDLIDKLVALAQRR